jgi:hypothetical protein
MVYTISHTNLKIGQVNRQIYKFPESWAMQMGARVQLREHDVAADTLPQAHSVTAERFFESYLAFEGDHKTFATVCLCKKKFGGVRLLATN